MTDTLDHDTPREPAADPARPAAPPAPSREEKVALRREQLRRRRIVAGVLAGVLLLLVAAGGWVVWGTSVLGLKTVQVDGTEGALDPALESAVTDVVGVAPGTPLIRVDLAAVRDRVETVPGVDSAEVSRHWPGTVRLAVTPRVAVAVVAANAALYLMDAEGVPYQTVAARPAGLVSLRLATPGPGDPATAAGLAVVAALPAGLVGTVASVTAANPYDITVQLTDGRSVIWGGATDNARKSQILTAVLARPGTTFDISDPGLVAVR
ncbi:cell division protein FtsQ/DivIB [Nakamurella deserti]|uniref:cell division protein FtsQ/DivIB n=1 Tax=Nakamurella deserti TaxID=2164074 RepID=UPI000DBE6D8A|nr:FtsQ-type POTRA domain-containing protein [Nakamurella deserti]